MAMAKEKVTLTLDVDDLEQLRDLVGARSLSAGVSAAVSAHVRHLRHLAAVDEWLAEMDDRYGPVPADELAAAEAVVDRWDARRRSRQPA
jgi:hypothetical protein